MDYSEKDAALARHRNPFATVVLAHLHTQATQGQPEARYALKWQLTRSLYERGYTKRDVQLLFRFIDWVMQLPPVLTEQFSSQVIAYEEERTMAYVTQTLKFLQEKAREEGWEEGIQQKARENMLKVLTLRFGEPPSEVVEQIHSLEDTDILDALHAQAVLAKSLEAFRRTMDDLLGPASQSTPSQG